MHNTYRIVRTNGSLESLARLIEIATEDGWKESGAPFRDSEAGQWCLAMTKPKAPAEARLREPKHK